MPRVKGTRLETPLPQTPRGRSLASREQQMINYAVDLAEIQLREGTASPLVVAHYLKLGSTRELLEQERIRHQNELARVKAEAIEAEQHRAEDFKEAIAAMARYRGEAPPEDYQ